MSLSEVEYEQKKRICFLLGELFQVLKMMVGSNLKDSQLQQIVDKVKKERKYYLEVFNFFCLQIDNYQCRQRW
jgi:hypothetical protein